MCLTIGPVERLAISVLFRVCLLVEMPGQGFINLTSHLALFLFKVGAGDGLLSVLMPYTSDSLAGQENADSDVRADLLDALIRLALECAFYRHNAEGPDDMPAHIRTMLTDTLLVLPVVNGRISLGTWQVVYLVEHRATI